MFIDSHAHLNFREYKDEIPEVIKRAQEAGVGVIINVGSNHKSSAKAIEIAKQYSNDANDTNEDTNDTNKINLTAKSQKLKAGIYASVGIHPIHLVKDIVEKATFDGREYSFKTRKEDFDYDKYKKLAQSSKKVVAIGETGIDLFRLDEKENDKLQITNVKKIQTKVFRQHIKLARELDLPLIIHGRGTKEDPYGVYDLILEILKSFTSEVKGVSTSEVGIRGVAHCFAGNLKQVKEFVKLGFYIGFTGIVTFKNAKEIQEIAREIPLEKILIETDCPFLAPEPYRGKRNEPAYVVEVAKKIAELKNILLEKVENQTTENVKKLFQLSTN